MTLQAYCDIIIKYIFLIDHYGREEDLVTKVEKTNLGWFGHVEKITKIENKKCGVKFKN